MASDSSFSFLDFAKISVFSLTAFEARASFSAFSFVKVVFSCSKSLILAAYLVISVSLSLIAFSILRNSMGVAFADVIVLFAGPGVLSRTPAVILDEAAGLVEP